MLRSSLAIATLGGLVASGMAALPAQADKITTAGHRGGVRTADPAHIPAALTAIAAARHQLGTLTGVVVGGDGRPLAGACVAATGAAGSTTTRTRADGRYVLTRLRPGRYALRYTGCASAQRSSSHTAPSPRFQAQPTAVTAAAASVASGVKILPTITMPAASLGPTGERKLRTTSKASASGTGQIRGVVTGSGHPVGGVCVAASPAGNGFVPTTRTSSNGHYTLRKVLAGRYFVEFAETDSLGCRDPGNWLSQWYKGITSPFMPGKATTVRVGKGTITRGISASLRRGGQISGTVRTKSGTPITGICVTVDGRVTGGFTESIPRTGKLGRYVVHGLFRGSYVVGFKVGCGSTGNFAPQWWRHAATRHAATNIRIVGTRKVANVDGALARGSAIAGVVRAGSLSGQRLPGICVDAINFRTGVSADGRTNRNGDYKLIGLSAGTYVVQYQTGCGNRGNYRELEQKVTVAKGQTRRGVDVALKPGAGVSGTVTNTHGEPVAGICVDINSPRGSSFEVETNPDGIYKATGLIPATYKVEFSGGCDNSGSYLPQYYNGKSTQATADPVKLTAGHMTTGIDATMQPGATITGTVTDAAGHRLSGVCVGIDNRSEQFLSVDGEFTDIEFTDNGSYRASNLTPGAFAVNFGCGVGRVASQWFRSRRAAPGADLVSAPAGQVTSGIGAVMHPAGSITGTVTSHTGMPLRHICELAVPVGGQYPPVIVLGLAGSSTSGRYRISHLAAWRYDVQLFGCNGGRYGSQWFRGMRTQGSATPVRVRAGQATTHIDAKLGLGGSISGRVVSSTGQSTRGFCAEAFDPATESLGLGFADSTGHYKITGLSTGAYQVLAYKCSGSNLAVFTRPGHVRVHAPEAVTGITVRLPSSGSIKGTVLAGAPPAPRGDLCVLIIPRKPSGSFGLAFTKSDGTYKVSGLAAGQYQVNFADPYCFLPDDDLAPQWFNHQQTQATANDVTVTAGATTGGINATLVNNGSISGSVIDQAHAPVAGECVTAVPIGAGLDPFLETARSREIAVTSANGRYSLAAVLPGRYKVEFSTGCGDAGFRTQWWEDAGSAAAAAVIAVGAGASVTGIDAVLKH